MLLLFFLSAIGKAEAEIIRRAPPVLIVYPYDERLAATSIIGEIARVRPIETYGGKIWPGKRRDGGAGAVVSLVQAS
ncbi:hypothetical protein I6F26_18915 [Ensifer sp. IC3342]|nr:hypothetical protein [Ensifer sp. BRP08]MCA1448653.1 hypothetical protein [Ensifer sp. IC3342]